MQITVTGASGLLGSSVARALVADPRADFYSQLAADLDQAAHSSASAPEEVPAQ